MKSTIIFVAGAMLGVWVSSTLAMKREIRIVEKMAALEESNKTLRGMITQQELGTCQ